MAKLKQQLLHSPTLETVLMIEKTSEKYSGEVGKYQLWKKLPRKVMYQTFLTVLDYLIESNKIVIDRDGRVIWIWNPALIKRLEKEGLMIR